MADIISVWMDEMVFLVHFQASDAEYIFSYFHIFFMFSVYL